MWFFSLRQTPVAPRQDVPARRFRPRFELLESRTVPATLLVNTTLDVLGHDGGQLSLRQAILDANQSPGASSIVVPAGTYTLTRHGANEDAGFDGDLDIASHLSITGAGAGASIVDAGGVDHSFHVGLDRVFHILNNADVSLSGLTIQGGRSADDGAGIHNQGTLTIRDCTITGNEGMFDFFRWQYNTGGGIANSGTLTVQGSFVSGNTSVVAAGIFNALGGAMTISNCIVSGNATNNEAGGILNQGSMKLKETTVSNNFATYGAGVANGGTLTVSNCIVSDNFALQQGGGLLNGGTLTVSHSTLTRNSARGRGGAIDNIGTLVVNNSTLSGNSATFGYGGGIFNASFGTICDSIFSDNFALTGGGIFNDYFAALTVLNSPLSGNSAHGQGGAIANAGMLTVSNSSVFGNAANQGGGLCNFDSGVATVRESTFTGNSANDFGGGITNFGELTLRNSAVTGNSARLGDDLYNADLVYVFDSLIADRYDV